MGIDPGSKTQNGQEAKTGNYTAGKGGDYQVACHQPTQGAIPAARRRWRTACPPTANVNVVYTINEPAADGALQALKAAGKSNVVVVTIDGSCKYVNGLLKQGTIAADSAQYPGKMASAGVEDHRRHRQGRRQADTARGQGLHRLRHEPRHRQPADRDHQPDPDQAAQACWGS